MCWHGKSLALALVVPNTAKLWYKQPQQRLLRSDLSPRQQTRQMSSTKSLARSDPYVVERVCACVCLCVPVCLSLTHSLTHTHTHSFTHTHTRAHTHSHSLTHTLSVCLRCAF